MAVKKAAVKKAAGGKALQKWDEELARLANLAAGMEASTLSGGNFINTQGGIMVYNGSPVPGNKLNAIVLGHVLHNMFFPEKFDRNKPTSPSCYAFGAKESTMTPHEKSEDPQNPKCVGCPQLEWGSADTGKGKACAEKRRLMLIPENSLDDMEEAHPAMLHVPVTSTQAWAGYVTQLANTLQRPPLGVITEISLHPDPKNQFRMDFKLVRALDSSDDIEACINCFKNNEAALTAPYAANSERSEKPTRGRASPAGRKGGAAVKRVPAPAKKVPAKAKGRR